MKAFVRRLFTFSLILTVGLSYAQEYDDLYFNRKDRKEKRNKTSTNSQNRDLITSGSSLNAETTDIESSEDKQVSFLGRQHGFNPDYYNHDTYVEELEAKDGTDSELIEYYKQRSIAAYQQTNGMTTAYDNSNYNTSHVQEEPVNDPVIINNYYGNDLGGGFNNPWTFNNRWNVGFGVSPWGWNGFAVGNRWNNWGWGGFHDPFFDPFWGGGFGWNSWGNNNWGWNTWCPAPFVVGRPIAVVYDSEFSRGRAVRRGATPSRGGTTVRRGSGRTTDLPRNAVSSQRNTGSNSSVTQQNKNSARAQRTYNDQSRVASQRAQRNVNSRSNSSRNATSYRSNSNSTNSSRSGSSYSRGSSNSSRSNSSGYSRSSSSRSGGSYSRSRNSSGSSRSSYSSGSRSRSSGGSGSRSSSSRSSGGSSRSNRGN